MYEIEWEKKEKEKRNRADIIERQYYCCIIKTTKEGKIMQANNKLKL